jgi:hypothetical protein
VLAFLSEIIRWLWDDGSTIGHLRQCFDCFFDNQAFILLSYRDNIKLLKLEVTRPRNDSSPSLISVSITFFVVSIGILEGRAKKVISMNLRSMKNEGQRRTANYSCRVIVQYVGTFSRSSHSSMEKGIFMIKSGLEGSELDDHFKNCECAL